MGSVIFVIGSVPPPSALPCKQAGDRRNVIVGVGKVRDSGMTLVGGWGGGVLQMRCLCIRTGNQVLALLYPTGRGPGRCAGGPPQRSPIGRIP